MKIDLDVFRIVGHDYASSDIQRIMSLFLIDRQNESTSMAEEFRFLFSLKIFHITVK